MNPIKQSAMIKRLDGGLATRSPVVKHRGSPSNGWFSLSSSAAAAIIHTRSSFAAGTSIEDISSTILSYITEDDER